MAVCNFGVGISAALAVRVSYQIVNKHLEGVCHHRDPVPATTAA